MKKLFGMVSTASSVEYTFEAITSFFSATDFKTEVDSFVLIDNDCSLPESYDAFPITIIKNSSPVSYAKNANCFMKKAQEQEADLFLINNDLIFCKGWLSPLLVPNPWILSPLSNREEGLIIQNKKITSTLVIDDFRALKEDFYEKIKEIHSRKPHYLQVISIPFFCVKIPYTIYTKIGFLDERFGVGGAEDNDYCIRTILEGGKLAYATNSYVLHFNGKSTWDGAEDKEATKKRCDLFTEKFYEKWGTLLTKMYINLNYDILDTDEEAKKLMARNDFKSLLQHLQQNSS
jgi:GT2 family glycosyltransferase